MQGKEHMTGTWNKAKYQNKRPENLNKKQTPRYTSLKKKKKNLKM